MRFRNLDFDQRQHQHPDERSWALTSAALEEAKRPPSTATWFGPVVDWLHGQRSGANPYRGTPSFVYGPATLAVDRQVARWMNHGYRAGRQPQTFIVKSINRFGVPLIHPDGNPRFDAAYDVDLVGRLLSAAIDTATIVLVAMIGRKLGGARVAIVAATLQALSPLSIQYAHFMGAEPLLQFCAALILLAHLRFREQRTTRRALALGLACGAALAIKLTAAAVVLVPAAWIAYEFVAKRNRLHSATGWHGLRSRFQGPFTKAVAFALGGFAVFRVLNPSAFVGLGLRLNPVMLDDYARLREFTGSDSPPWIQWSARIPFLYPAENLLRWAIGPGAVAAAAIGVWTLWRRRDVLGVERGLILIGAIVVPFTVIGFTPTPYARYFIVLLPAVHLVGAVGVVAMYNASKVSTSWRPVAGTVLASFSVVFAGVWGFAFSSGVHGRTFTRAAATEWIAANVPSGAVLSSEAWDDELPLRLPGIDQAKWNHIQLEMFPPDQPAKMQRLAGQLQTIDYIVESSNRVWGSVRRIPIRFPATIAFFDSLDKGTLGFTRVATFRSGPRIGPFTIDDSGGEESLSVYDHPEVRIWKKTTRLDQSEILLRLGVSGISEAFRVPPALGPANGLMLRPAEVKANQRGGTYASEFSLDTSPWLHALGWFVGLELLGFAAFVIAAPHLRNLPDAGLGAAKVLGLLAAAVPVWMLAAWTPVRLNQAQFVATFISVLTFGALRLRRTLPGLRTLWTERRTTLITVELITVALFVAVLALRATNPDLWHPSLGGEKPFETAYLTSVLRTRTIPPVDPWFAGGALNYYYFGWFAISPLARILSTQPSVAFNLALAVFASGAGGAVFSAASGLAGGFRRTAKAEGNVSANDAPGDNMSANNEPGVNVSANNVLGDNVPAASQATLRAGLAGVLLVVLGANSAAIPVALRAIRHQRAVGSSWWDVSRVVPKGPVITEFPAWSYLFGDLHPHLMDVPFLAALVALCVARIRHDPSVEDVPETLPEAVSSDGAPDGWFRSRRDVMSDLAWGSLFGGMLGVIRATNTWDLPLAGVLVAGTIGLSTFRSIRKPDTPDARRLALLTAGRTGAAAAIVFLVAWSPYSWRGEVLDSGFLHNNDLTPMHSWLTHFGLFAAATAALVLRELVTAMNGRSRGASWRAKSLVTVGFVMICSLIVLLGSVTVANLALAGAGLVLVVIRRRDHRLLGPVLLAGGWLLGALVERYTIINDIGRMNTVFKFWYQSWFLLGLGVAACVGELLSATVHSVHPAKSAQSAQSAQSGRSAPLVDRTIGRLVIVAAMVFSITFFAISVQARQRTRFATTFTSLDGFEYLKHAPSADEEGTQILPADDVAAIDWLRRNVSGLKTVAEAPGNDYRWSGRVGVMTGLPVPIGWDFHQSQQRRRYTEQIAGRRTAMNALYQSGNDEEIRQILQGFKIDYVFVGTEEHRIASRRSLEALAENSCLRPAFRSKTATVYATTPSCQA